MAFQLSSDERIYAQVTHPYSGLFPNTAGTSTLAATDIIPVTSFRVNSNAGLIDSSAKVNGLGRAKGFAGRRDASWEATFPLQPSGAAGTVPNLDQIFQALVGATPTVSAGVSVGYAFPSSGAPSQLSFFRYRTAGSNVFQRAIRGALVNTFSVKSGDGELICTVGGPCSGEIDSVNFASYDTGDKGGLTSFPAEPASPVSVGSSIADFLGAGAVVNSVSTHPVESFGLNMSMNRGLRPRFGERAGTIPTAQLRDVNFDLGLYEENTAAMAALRLLWYQSTGVPVTFEWGTVAGYKMKITMPNCVLPSETEDEIDGQTILRWSGAKAFTSVLGANDEVSILFT